MPHTEGLTVAAYPYCTPCAVYFPAAILVTRKLYGSHATMRRAFALAVALLNPALIIIDHGHFQYNCISLGLSVSVDFAHVLC